VIGIFISLSSFRSGYKGMADDDFCLQMRNKAKIRFIFIFLLIFSDDSFYCFLMIVFVDLKLLIFFC